MFAAPQLIDGYQMGGAQDPSRLQGEPKIILDNTLEATVRGIVKLASIRRGGKIRERMPTIVALIMQELAGDVIAYKNSEGQLAWKASPGVVEKLSGKPEGVVDGETVV